MKRLWESLPDRIHLLIACPQVSLPLARPVWWTGPAGRCCQAPLGHDRMAVIPAPFEIRYEVAAAVTWRIIAELFRRYHKSSDLRVYELHPGGGTYDCLALRYRDYPRGNQLCHFHVPACHFHLFGAIGSPRRRLEDLRWPEGNNYVVQYLCGWDPKNIIDEISGLLGIPEPAHQTLPPTSPPVFMVRLIAELTGMMMLERHGIEVRSGYLDSSGYPSETIRADLKLVRKIAEQIPEEESAQYGYGMRFWIFYRRTPHGTVPKLILDLRGVAYILGKEVEEASVWDAFRANAPIERLASMLREQC